MQFRPYLRNFLFAFLGIGGAIAVINITVDPYATFRWSDIPGFNDQKTLKRDGGRVNKAIILNHRPFDVLFFGSSQGEMGLNPASPVLGGMSAFNASLSNVNLHELKQAAAYAAQVQSPKLVVVALDWFTFSTSQVTFADFAQSGFSGAGHLPAYVKRTFGSLALHDSFSVVGKSWRHKPQVFNKLGFVDPSLRGPFDHQSEFALTLRDYSTPDNPSKSKLQRSFPAFVYAPERVGELRDMLTPFMHKGAKVLLFVSPVHAQFMDALIASGRLEDFELWKRDVTAMAAAVQAERPGAMELWDFSGYNSVTTEDVPPSGGSMRWYWDPVHFNAATGDLVLSRMLGRGAVPPDFGQQLTPETVEATNLRLREGRARYMGRTGTGS